MPASQSAVRLGVDILISGDGIVGANTIARLARVGGTDTIELPLRSVAEGRFEVHLPTAAENPTLFGSWQPGLYNLSVIVGASGAPRMISNELPFALAPVIQLASTTAAAGDVTLTVTCSPRVDPAQRVLLLFGDRAVQPVSVAPTTQKFAVSDVKAGTYVVRLRVDGADSIPVVLTGSPAVPSFDPAQTMVVT
jgi:hypothetical protein